MASLLTHTALGSVCGWLNWWSEQPTASGTIDIWQHAQYLLVINKTFYDTAAGYHKIEYV